MRGDDTNKAMLAAACEEFAPSDPYCYCLLNAVFIHDSSWATAGVGKRNNNPGNLRCLSVDSPFNGTCVASPGNGSFEKFATLEDGIRANVDLYVRRYMGLPPDVMTFKWAQTKNGNYYDALAACFAK